MEIEKFKRGNIVQHKSQKGPYMAVIEVEENSNIISCRMWNEKARAIISDTFLNVELSTIGQQPDPEKTYKIGDVVRNGLSPKIVMVITHEEKGFYTCTYWDDELQTFLEERFFAHELD